MCITWHVARPSKTQTYCLTLAHFQTQKIWQRFLLARRLVQGASHSHFSESRFIRMNSNSVENKENERKKACTHKNTTFLNEVFVEFV